MRFSFARPLDVARIAALGCGFGICVSAGFLLCDLGSHPFVAFAIKVLPLVGAVVGAVLIFVISMPVEVRISKAAAQVLASMLQRSGFSIVCNDENVIIYCNSGESPSQRFIACVNTVALLSSSDVVRVRMPWFFKAWVWSRIGIKGI